MARQKEMGAVPTLTHNSKGRSNKGVNQVAEELLDQVQDSSSLKSSKKEGAEKQGRTPIGSRQLK